MSDLISKILISTFSIFVLALSPLPALPAIIYNYSSNGNIVGFFTTVIAASLARIVQYHIGIGITNNFILKFFKRINLKSKKYSKMMNRISFLELFFLMLSNTIPNTIIAISCGMSHVKFKKFIVSCILSFIPIQIIFIFASTQYKNYEENFSSNIYELLVGISISSLFAFLLLIILRWFSNRLSLKIKSVKNFKSFIKLKNKKNNIKK